MCKPSKYAHTCSCDQILLLNLRNGYQLKYRWLSPLNHNLFINTLRNMVERDIESVMSDITLVDKVPTVDAESSQDAVKRPPVVDQRGVVAAVKI